MCFYLFFFFFFRFVSVFLCLFWSVDKLSLSLFVVFVRVRPSVVGIPSLHCRYAFCGASGTGSGSVALVVVNLHQTDTAAVNTSAFGTPFQLYELSPDADQGTPRDQVGWLVGWLACCCIE